MVFSKTYSFQENARSFDQEVIHLGTPMLRLESLVTCVERGAQQHKGVPRDNGEVTRQTAK